MDGEAFDQRPGVRRAQQPLDQGNIGRVEQGDPFISSSTAAAHRSKIRVCHSALAGATNSACPTSHPRNATTTTARIRGRPRRVYQVDLQVLLGIGVAVLVPSSCSWASIDAASAWAITGSYSMANGASCGGAPYRYSAWVLRRIVVWLPRWHITRVRIRQADSVTTQSLEIPAA
jgi:hypothetical protein